MLRLLVCLRHTLVDHIQLLRVLVPLQRSLQRFRALQENPPRDLVARAEALQFHDEFVLFSERSVHFHEHCDELYFQPERIRYGDS